MTNIPGRKNIFEFATKELTLDAMVAWFMECSRNNKSKPYSRMGLDFINTFIFDDNSEDVELIECELQYYKMDVFAVIRKENTFHPIIFEDKVNTNLSPGKSGSPGQLVAYCKKMYDWIELEKRFLNDRIDERKDSSRSNILKNISKKYISNKKNDYQWGKIYYVYFKIGFIHSADTEEYKKQINELCKYKKYNNSLVFPPMRDIKLMNDFLSRNYSRMSEDLLLKDYKKYITKEYNKIQQSLDGWDKIGEERNISLSSYPGQHEFYVHAFGKDVISIPGIPYGGKEALKHEIDLSKYLSTEKKVSPKKEIKYFFTFKFRKDKLNKDSDIQIPVLSFQQYRNDNNNKAIDEDRIKEYEIIQSESKKIISKLLKKQKYSSFSSESKFKFGEIHIDRRAYDAIDIFDIQFYDDEKSEEVPSILICSFLKDFKNGIL